MSQSVRALRTKIFYLAMFDDLLIFNEIAWNSRYTRIGIGLALKFWMFMWRDYKIFDDIVAITGFQKQKAPIEF